MNNNVTHLQLQELKLFINGIKCYATFHKPKTLISYLYSTVFLNHNVSGYNITYATQLIRLYTL
jgi:hypothetical protein